MREIKQDEIAPASRDPANVAWREELLNNAFEITIGISRLMATVQNGPLQASPPRKRRLSRRSR
jgi:hypothetical protein